MTDLTPEQIAELAEAAFERVWQVVKDWDISTEPGEDRLYEGINGDHVRAVTAAALAGPEIAAMIEKAREEERERCARIAEDRFPISQDMQAP